MKIDALRLGVATAIGLAIIWILCVVFIWLLPTTSMGIFADMMHSNIADMGMGWHLTFSGIFVGMLAWAVCGGITVWLIATIYNKLSYKDG
ncbi:DUF5676 family membrane protein [Kangiella shandongensis]|uniref:DUF5676 family membrane protein n=1 Tax=Kangiella shandongensis TaxID=2763258 RepID=UPI001CBB65AF|nr:DUF5676 family membrane protein [Kangiella shandongensis]